MAFESSAAGEAACNCATAASSASTRSLVPADAGVAAIISIPEFSDLQDYRVELGVGLILFITLMNLRGIKESGRLFAAPTYLCAGAVVVAAGVVSALIVRNRIDNLDLVGVLKTRE